MRTLADLLEDVCHLTGAASGGWPAGFKKGKLAVPGENPVLLPVAEAGLTPVISGPAILDLSPEQSIDARSLLVSQPALTFAMVDPQSDELAAVGIDQARFRHERPRAIATAAAVRGPSGEMLFGVSRTVIVENHLRMGSGAIVSIEEQWSPTVDTAEEVLGRLLAMAKPSLSAQPDSTASAWRTALILLGGTNEVGDLPEGWKRHLQLMAGLRRVRLAIWPHPERRRASVVHEITSSPPDALLVWADWVANPSQFLVPYLGARPGGYAELLGTSDRSLTYDEQVDEFRLHLRLLAPLGESRAAEQSRSVGTATWPAATAQILRLRGPHFVLTDRAVGMLTENPYPDPERMLWHIDALARAALAYREAEGRLGERFVDFAASFEIEVALFDDSLSVPTFSIDGVDYTAKPHVKVDDHVTPERCGRIYFAIDSANKRLIVDHIGLHDYG